MDFINSLCVSQFQHTLARGRVGVSKATRVDLINEICQRIVSKNI